MACVGFGAATSTALVAVTPLDAAIVYSGPQNIVLSGTINSTAIDMDGGLVDFHAFYAGGPSQQSVFGVNGALIAGTGSGSNGRAKKFSSGQTIGTPGSSFGSYVFPGPYGATGFAYFNNFTVSQPAFVGIQLGSGNFGWIQVHVNPNSLEVVDWAYDDMGAHISAGATGQNGVVPEPASAVVFMGLGLISMEAAGVRELRRRKREAAALLSNNTATAG